MDKTRPGVDRITKQQLQAAHGQAATLLHRHLTQCFTCKRAGANIYGRCDAWWHLAKAEHRTAKALREYKQPETQGMTPLFGVEQWDPPPF